MQPDAGLDAGADAASTGCGDGVVDPGEECDLGPRNRDVPAYAVRQDSPVFEILPRVVGDHRDVASFYDYRSESAHTGYEAPRLANLLVYEDRDSDERFLVLVFSQDDGGFDGTAAIDVGGLVGSDLVVLGDEPNELSVSGAGMVSGRFQWFSNSDGGVIRLECPLVATVTLGATTFVDEWRWSGRGVERELNVGAAVEIECNTEPSACRTDCRVPRCGDGFLDPGEHCDDDPGCPPDCRL